MRERILVLTSWAAIFAAMVAMIVGHAGATSLTPLANQISTYAAQAPHQGWITAGIVLPGLALASMAMLISGHRMLGDSWLAHVAPLLAGAATAGLLTLALFKETAPTMAALKNAGIEEIVQQSMHNAGLMIFFYSTMLLLMLCGGLTFARSAGWPGKLLGVSAALLGLAAFPLMTESWPRVLGITGPVHGLMQRASLLSLWLGASIVLLAARPPALALLRNKAAWERAQ